MFFYKKSVQINVYDYIYTFVSVMMSQLGFWALIQYKDAILPV